MGVWLRIAISMRMALLWAFWYGTLACIVVFSKLAFLIWGLGVASLDFTGVSGHAAISALVWPVLAALLACAEKVAVRALAMGLGLLLAIIIGCTRVGLGVHSVSEVIAGFLLGSSAALALLSRFRTESRFPRRRRCICLALAVLLVVPVIYGHRFPSDQLLRFAATQMGHSQRPFTRVDLRDR